MILGRLALACLGAERIFMNDLRYGYAFPYKNVNL